MHISHIDLFDQNMSMASAKVRLICSWLSPVLIYLIKMQIWHVSKLHSDVNRCHIDDQNACMTVPKLDSDTWI